MEENQTTENQAEQPSAEPIVESNELKSEDKTVVEQEVLETSASSEKRKRKKGKKIQRAKGLDFLR